MNSVWGMLRDMDATRCRQNAGCFMKQISLKKKSILEIVRDGHGTISTGPKQQNLAS